MRKTETTPNPQSRWGNVLFFGLPIALFLSLLGLLVLSTLLTYTSLSESTATLISRLISPITVFIVSLILGMRASSQGWLSGFLLAIFYAVVLFFFRGFGYGQFSFSGGFWISVLLVVLAGIVGGILGINLSTKRR